MAEYIYTFFSAEVGGRQMPCDGKASEAGKTGGGVQDIREHGLPAKIRKKLITSKTASKAGGHDDASHKGLFGDNIGSSAGGSSETSLKSRPGISLRIHPGRFRDKF